MLSGVSPVCIYGSWMFFDEHQENVQVDFGNFDFENMTLATSTLEI